MQKVVKKAKPEMMRMEYIKWQDAALEVSNMGNQPDSFISLVHCESVGILAAETKTIVSLALEYFPVDGDYRYILHIPKGMIVKRKRLATLPVKREAIR